MAGAVATGDLAAREAKVTIHLVPTARAVTGVHRHMYLQLVQAPVAVAVAVEPMLEVSAVMAARVVAHIP